MLRRFPLLAVCLLWTATFLPAGAQDAPKTDKPKAESVKETQSTTKHSTTVNGAKLEYEATAGTLVLRDDDGKPRASVFYVAYVKSDVKDAATRPLTFAFNGGPGSSSVWLHLGTFGPRRIALDDNGKSLAPPYKLVDNEATLLDATDIVFIDPVSTGYSRAAPGVDAKQFHGVQEDVEANASFIRQYVTKYRRWNSPKFLAGESYGTTRAAALSNYLQDQDGLNLNGVILISSVLNFGTIRFDEGNDLPYPLFLPSYTATAWYHKKLTPELQGDLTKALAEAEKFALNEYATALLKGASLSSEERQSVARQLARLTGLSEEYVLRSDLRVDASRFRKELLRKDERTVGRFDSRFQGTDLDAVGDRPDYDPSYGVVQGAYTALVNQYLRNELKYETDLTYRILTDKVQPWNYGGARNRYLNVAPSLRQAMTKNPGVRVFVASGLYDLATPYFATRHTFDHLGLDRKQYGRVTYEQYPAGHMMYIESASLVKLKKDLAKFVKAGE